MYKFWFFNKVIFFVKDKTTCTRLQLAENPSNVKANWGLFYPSNIVICDTLKGPFSSHSHCHFDIGVNVDDYISYLFSVHQTNNQSRGTYRAIIPCPQFLAVGTSWGGFQINHFNDLYRLRYWPCTLNQHYGLEVDSHLM